MLEKQLLTYLLCASEIFFDLNPTQVKLLVFNLANKNNVSAAKSWMEFKQVCKNCIFEASSINLIEKTDVKNLIWESSSDKVDILAFLNNFLASANNIWNMD